MLSTQLRLNCHFFHFDQRWETMAAIPAQARSKQLRACLLCSIIQLPIDFRKNGCPNCEELMQVRELERALITSTLLDFDHTTTRLDERQSRQDWNMHNDLLRRSRRRN